MKAHQEEMAHLLPGQRWKRRRRKYFFLIYKYGSVDARAPVLHPTRYFRLSTKRRGRKKRRPNSSELMTAAFSRSVLFFFLFFFFFFSNAQVRHRWLIPNEKRTARKKQCARMCTHLSLLLLPFLFFFPRWRRGLLAASHAFRSFTFTLFQHPYGAPEFPNSRLE